MSRAEEQFSCVGKAASFAIFALARMIGASLSGCGSGGSSGATAGGGGTQTSAMGTLTAVSDSDGYTLKNSASSMVLGIGWPYLK